MYVLSSILPAWSASAAQLLWYAGWCVTINGDSHKWEADFSDTLREERLKDTQLIMEKMPSI